MFLLIGEKRISSYSMDHFHPKRSSLENLKSCKRVRMDVVTLVYFSPYIFQSFTSWTIRPSPSFPDNFAKRLHLARYVSVLVFSNSSAILFRATFLIHLLPHKPSSPATSNIKSMRVTESSPLKIYPTIFAPHLQVAKIR